jgi:hypothetical protein
LVSPFAGNWRAFAFWRFVFTQQEVAKLAQTALEFPPMQPGTSFNLSAVKAQIEKAIANRSGQERHGWDCPGAAGLRQVGCSRAAQMDPQV